MIELSKLDTTIDNIIANIALNPDVGGVFDDYELDIIIEALQLLKEKNIG